MSENGERRGRLAATVVAAAASGFASTRRDSGVAVGLFLLPLLVIGLIGVAIQGYSDPVFTVGFIDDSGSAEAAAFREALASEPTVRIRDYADVQPMHLAVYRGRLHAGVRVPSGWTGQEDLDIHATAAGVGAIVVRAIAEARLARALAPERARDVPSRVHDGSTEGSPPIGFDYTAPSNLVLFLMVSGMVASSGVLLLRQRGITRRLLATPARTGELVMMTLVAPGQMMVVQAVFLIASTGLAFGVDWGQPLAVGLVTLALISTALSLTLLASTLFRTPEQAFSLAPLVAICVGMLGGCMWPLAVVPAWLRDAGHAFPTAWAMDGYLALGFGDGGLVDVLPHVGALLAMTAIFGTIGWVRFRNRMAR